MVQKFINTMNYTIIFKCCIGYQIYFSLIGFWPARQWWPSWRVWGSSLMLSLVSVGIPPFLPYHLSVLSDGILLQRRYDSWWCSDDGVTISLCWINFGVGVNFIVGVNFVPRDNFTGGQLSLECILPYQGNIPWDISHGTVLGVFVPQYNT